MDSEWIPKIGDRVKIRSVTVLDDDWHAFGCIGYVFADWEYMVSVNWDDGGVDNWHSKELEYIDDDSACKELDALIHAPMC